MEIPFKDKRFEIQEKSMEVIEAVKYTNKIKGSFFKSFNLFNYSKNICLNNALVNKIPEMIKEILLQNKHIQIISKTKRSLHVMYQLITSILNFSQSKIIVLNYHNDFQYDKINTFHMKVLRLSNVFTKDIFNDRVILSSSLFDLSDIIAFMKEINKFAAFVNQKFYLFIPDFYYLLEEKIVDLSFINPNLITVIYLSKYDRNIDLITSNYEEIKLLLDKTEFPNELILLDQNKQISFCFFN